MSGLDGLSSSSDSGADRGDRRGDREEDRPFPGAPLDRPPAPPVPEGTLSWDEIMADPATYEAALKEMHAGRDSYSGTLDALNPSWDSSDSSGAADASHRDTADSADEVAQPGVPRLGAAEPERSDRAERPFPAVPAENAREKEQAGDNRADASGDDTGMLRQEIASLKADNAQQKAEIESVTSEVSGLKNEIAEIKETLRERDPNSGPDTPPEGAGQKEPKPDDQGTLMHAHSEFHGEKLDLYTDGTRWVSGDATRAAQGKREHKPEAPRLAISDVPRMRDQGSNVIGERPDDEADLPPEREELMEADNGKRSRMDRLRQKHGDQEYVENLHDNTQEQFNDVQKVLDSWHPQGNPVQTVPGPIYEPVPVQNHAATGDVVAAALMASIMITEGARRIHDMLAPNREAER